MKKTILSILAVVGLTVGGGYLVTEAYHVGVAQAQSGSSVPLEPVGSADGSGSGSSALEASGSGSSVAAPAPVKPTVTVPDPTEDLGGFYGIAVEAKTKGGWLGLIFVVTYGLVTLLGKFSTKYKFLAFFARDNIATVLSGISVTLSGAIDALFLGGTLATILVAGIYALVGWLGTSKKKS